MIALKFLLCKIQITYLIRRNFRADKFSRIFTQKLNLREIARKLVPNFWSFSQVSQNFWKSLKNVVLAKYLREMAWKFVPNFDDLWKVREYKSANFRADEVFHPFFKRIWEIVPINANGGFLSSLYRKMNIFEQNGIWRLSCLFSLNPSSTPPLSTQVRVLSSLRVVRWTSEKVERTSLQRTETTIRSGC